MLQTAASCDSPNWAPTIHCRDNVTMFPGHTVVGFYIFTIFALWLLHLNTEAINFFQFFLSLELNYVVALSLS